MGTPANIIIEYVNADLLLPKKKDKILLFCGSDGYPFKLQGIIYLILIAYENLKHTSRRGYSGIFNELSPPNFASELIRVSLYAGLGVCRIIPASELMYEQFKKEDYFVDCAYKYVCSFSIDESSGHYDLKLTLVGGSDAITIPMEEWKSVSDIAYLIGINQKDDIILMNDAIPCKECLVRSTCLNNRPDGAYNVNDTCDPLREYKKNEIDRLKQFTWVGNTFSIRTLNDVISRTWN